MALPWLLSLSVAVFGELLSWGIFARSITFQQRHNQQSGLQPAGQGFFTAITVFRFWFREIQKQNFEKITANCWNTKNCDAVYGITLKAFLTVKKASKQASDQQVNSRTSLTHPYAQPQMWRFSFDKAGEFEITHVRIIRCDSDCWSERECCSHETMQFRWACVGERSVCDWWMLVTGEKKFNVKAKRECFVRWNDELSKFFPTKKVSNSIQAQLTTTKSS